MRRRPLLAALLPLPGLAFADRARAAPPTARPTAPAPSASWEEPAPPALGVSHRPLIFPADHGAHPDTHIEWWYVTGWLRDAAAASSTPEFGFQVTFFRSRTGLGAASRSRFAARQLVFAHVALAELGKGGSGGSFLHDQRAEREAFGLAATPLQAPAAGAGQVVRLGDWSLARRVPVADSGPASASALAIEVRSEHFALSLDLAGAQPLLLQGDAGWSQKGPHADEATHYYSEPQLALRGRLARAATGAGAHTGTRVLEVAGRAWLDHEWGDVPMPAEAVGWDWIGINLSDGAALTAFRLRRRDGSAVWAGGSFRDAGGTRRAFGAAEVAFHPQRTWTSPRTRIAWPVEFVVETPAGRWRVVALRDDQELDSRGSTGAVYWEGLAALQADANPAQGPAAGWGYLELTGYGDRLKL